MATIIKYLHKNDVILRNLRPESIVFEEVDTLDIKLMDLSLAIQKKDYVDSRQDYLFEEYQRMPAIFKAPELLTLKKTYDEQVDIWSAGCIIFNMVTGIPPFYESDESALKNTILHGKYKGYYPEFDKTTSVHLRELIAAMIALKPEDRISSDKLITSQWINSAL